MIGGLNIKLFRSACVYYKTLNQKYKNEYFKYIKCINYILSGLIIKIIRCDSEYNKTFKHIYKL